MWEEKKKLVPVLSMVIRDGTDFALCVGGFLVFSIREPDMDDVDPRP